jgi:hypothetical protein
MLLSMYMKDETVDQIKAVEHVVEQEDGSEVELRSAVVNGSEVERAAAIEQAREAKQRLRYEAGCQMLNRAVERLRPLWDQEHDEAMRQWQADGGEQRLEARWAKRQAKRQATQARQTAEEQRQTKKRRAAQRRRAERRAAREPRVAQQQVARQQQRVAQQQVARQQQRVAHQRAVEQRARQIDALIASWGLSDANFLPSDVIVVTSNAGETTVLPHVTLHGRNVTLKAWLITQCADCATSCVTLWRYYLPGGWRTYNNANNHAAGGRNGQHSTHMQRIAFNYDALKTLLATQDLPDLQAYRSINMQQVDNTIMQAAQAQAQALAREAQAQALAREAQAQALARTIARQQRALLCIDLLKIALIAALLAATLALPLLGDVVVLPSMTVTIVTMAIMAVETLFTFITTGLHGYKLTMQAGTQGEPWGTGKKCLAVFGVIGQCAVMAAAGFFMLNLMFNLLPCSFPLNIIIMGAIGVLNVMILCVNQYVQPTMLKPSI